MGGRLGLSAEVFAGCDDADAKIGLPDAVDEGAGGGGRIASDQPFSEGETVGGAGRWGVEIRGRAGFDKFGRFKDARARASRSRRFAAAMRAQ